MLLALQFSFSIESKDLGVFGATASIDEQDLIRFLQEKMGAVTEEERQVFMEAMRDHFTDRLNQLMEVKGIKKTTQYSVVYFDPTICVEHDIFNHQGQIIVKKGTSYNPLSQISMNHELLFFDATDLDQLAWAQSHSTATWILIKGQPLQLEESLKHPIFFDQSGSLTRKFGINQVPARVSQDGLRLKIEFIPVGEGSCAQSSS
jgi:conjugal transfer pilus assembly protein TraW